MAQEAKQEEKPVVEEKVLDPVAERKLNAERALKARWLQEGEEVEVIYGQFFKHPTPRKDDDTGNEYVTQDYRIGCRDPRTGQMMWKYVNHWTYDEIVDMFTAAKKAKDGEVLLYRRPFGNGGGSRYRRRR
jgi:hypothetical protein